MNSDVIFPVSVIFENGEVECYESVEDLERDLEDFDSDIDVECRVVDSFGRPVRLKLKLLEVKELSLVSAS
jgi:hypothetical protein